MTTTYKIPLNATAGKIIRDSTGNELRPGMYGYEAALAKHPATAGTKGKPEMTNMIAPRVSKFGRNSISPYPSNVTIKGDNVFKDGKYLGYIDKVQNWGTDFLARPESDQDNAFFATKTEAVRYLINYVRPIAATIEQSPRIFQRLLDNKATLSDLERAQLNDRATHDSDTIQNVGFRTDNLRLRDENLKVTAQRDEYEQKWRKSNAFAKLVRHQRDTIEAQRDALLAAARKLQAELNTKLERWPNSVVAASIEMQAAIASVQGQ